MPRLFESKVLQSSAVVQELKTLQRQRRAPLPCKLSVVAGLLFLVCLASIL